MWGPSFWQVSGGALGRADSGLGWPLAGEPAFLRLAVPQPLGNASPWRSQPPLWPWPPPLLRAFTRCVPGRRPRVHSLLGGLRCRPSSVLLSKTCPPLLPPLWAPPVVQGHTAAVPPPRSHLRCPECHSHPSASAGTSSLAQPPPPALALWGPSCPSWPCPHRPAPLYPLPAVCSPSARSSLCNVVVFIPMFPTQQLSLSTELCPVPGTGKAMQTACLPGVFAPGVGPATDL